MTSRYPLTLLSPEATATLPEVKRLVFDYLAERDGSGVDVIAVERMLLANDHHPGAAKILLAEWSREGALTRQHANMETVYYRLKVTP